MKEKKLLTIAVIAGMTLFFAGLAFADIPGPPVNQSLGFDDGIFNNMEEADCRLCHDDPGVVGPTPNVDRHHLLYGSALPQGECYVNGNACLSDADCAPGICSRTPVEACAVDDDCDKSHLGETCGEVCIGETAVPNLGAGDTHYGCFNCHDQDTTGGVTNFLVERDCLQCHVQGAEPTEGSVHHLLPVAQGYNSPLGDPAVGDCTPCHGTVVDDIGDNHTIPSYAPSLVTPQPSSGYGFPAQVGDCTYCHDAGTDTDTGVIVYRNATTHHNTGVYVSETGDTNDGTCFWCHDLFEPMADNIRYCEGCHGYESLHNIQADSNDDCCIEVGNELYGYGHVGVDNPADPLNDSDCWGCHGFSFASASAPGTGPTAPFITDADIISIPAGSDTAVTLNGSNFTNTLGAFTWTANIVLTAADGSTTVLTPDPITACQGTVTIPGSLAVGNYSLQAVKNDAVSNPVVVSITPAVAISDTRCLACTGVITINGSGFGEAPPEGSEGYINVTVDGVAYVIKEWSDTQIKAKGGCNYDSLTVNTLYGSAGSN